jgi:iron complex transport system ATP-binding protein
MTVLSAQDITVRRGGKAIVDAVSLACGGGAFVAVIGANGAGKSTLLSVLTGLVKPEEGQVVLDGRPLAEIGARALARRRAYLPQALRAEWPISVERLVTLGLLPHLPAFGGLPAVFGPRVTQALETHDLLDRREQPATTLSGGELSRAMLARALVGDPDILIADEPIAGLDPRHALDCAARLRGFALSGKLVIAALHDLTLTARYATHVAALAQGRLVAFGPVETVLTAELIRQVFDVEACISGQGRAAYVDFAEATGGQVGFAPRGQT